MSDFKSYDAIVVGLGAMGAGATYQLAKRGVRVLGLDMYPLGHDKGSSHGHHRLIRRSGYRPEIQNMTSRAFELWRELETETGRQIMTLNGEVALDSAGDDITRGGQRELLDETAVRERFPGFAMYEGLRATHEAEAGYLRPEDGVAAHLEAAERLGATVRRPETVTDWRVEGSGVVVTTTTATYRADRLVLTTGPWAAELLAGLDLPLQVVRIVNAYFMPSRPDLWTAEQGAPNFTLDVPEGSFYGLPSIEGVGLKIGQHDGGEPTTARTIRREVDAAEIDHLRAVLDRYMPGASGPVTESITCMYTMTPDEQFIIEAHPQLPQVVYGCGCSGSSYKYSGVIGEILADLALTGSTGYDIDFLSSARFTKQGDPAQGLA